VKTTHAILGPANRESALTCLKTADSLPVKRMTFPTSPPIFTSFGIKLFKFVLKHKVGCLNSLKSIMVSSFSRNTGLHDGSPMAEDDFARLKRQSNSAKTLIARSQSVRSASNSA